MTQLVAVMVEESIYEKLEKNLQRYTTAYIQKHYPQSKAIVLKINTKEYDAPELTKLLENLYFDGLKDQSSRLIGLVIFGEIPLPVVRYEDYIFPSIYPYVDFLEQKYVRDEESGYFIQNQKNGQAELRHGLINFWKEIQDYDSFFIKLRKYDQKPSKFVGKKIRYDDFIALKKHFLDEMYSLYQNRLLFAEDLIYHRYTNSLLDIFKGNIQERNAEVLSGLAEDLLEFDMKTEDVEKSLEEMANYKKEYTPTKLLEKKLEAYFKDYPKLISTPLLNTISENVKASDRRNGNDGHYQKLQLKDQLLLGNTKANGMIKSINDKLEEFVDKKVAQENYPMKTIVPYLYKKRQNIRRRILFKTYYIPKVNDVFRFFYFGKDAQTITGAFDFTTFRGSYRNLSGFIEYSKILNDEENPAKSKEDKTDLTKKGIGSSYDLLSTQADANRGFNVLNTEAEYELYKVAKRPKNYKLKCKKRRGNLPWWVPLIPCRKKERVPKKTCNPEGSKSKQKGCENFNDFWQRVWGGATPLNVDMEKFQNLVYAFKWEYDPRRATNHILDIAGSVPLTKIETDAHHYSAQKTYVSPIHIADLEGAKYEITYDTGMIEKTWYFNVPLEDKKFIPNGITWFTLFKKKKNRLDEELTYKYKIIDSKVKHNATNPNQIEGFSGLKYSEASEVRGHYQAIQDDLATPEDPTSAPLLANLTGLKAYLGEVKKTLDEATKNEDPEKIRNLLPELVQNTVKEYASGQSQRWVDFNDIIIRDFAADIENTIQGIDFRRIVWTQKILIFEERYNSILTNFQKLQDFIAEKEKTGDQIFSAFRNVFFFTFFMKNVIDTQILLHTKKDDTEKELREARQSLLPKMDMIMKTIEEINTSEDCFSNHGILWSMLGKEEKKIIFWPRNDSCGELETWEGNNGSSPLQEMIKNIEETKKELFIPLFEPDPENPEIHYSGMNILTPARPIDSPNYLSFQGVGENVIKLIYPDLFKVEAYTQSLAVLEIKNPDEMRKSLKTYLKNKVAEYNQILMQEKGEAKWMDQYYEYVKKVDPLATPSLESWVRSYAPFTYEEFLEAIGGEKMLNTIAELLYFQSITNQIKVYSDEIQKDIKWQKEGFDINERIAYIIDNYLAQGRKEFYENERNSFANFVIPSYMSKGYEVGYINSDYDDTILPHQEEAFETFNQEIEPPESPALDQSPADSFEAEEVKSECWFDINEGLLLYNFETKKFDRWEGLQCWLKEVKQKPVELKLSFEWSLGSVPFKESLSGDILSPLKDARNEYQEEFKPSVPFHDIPPYQINTGNKQLQEILNATQITVTNKKISVLNKTWSLHFLSFKNYGNLNAKISSTGDNCLLIKGKDTCSQTISLNQNPFKDWFNIPFELSKTTVGTIVATVELCTQWGQCIPRTISLFAVPGTPEQFELELPKEKKILAGAYTLIDLKAFDRFHNEILRTLEPYTLTVNKGDLIIWGQKRKTQEIQDFQNTTLLYQAEEGSAGIVQFTLKSHTGSLLLTNTAHLIPGKLELEYKGKPVKDLQYEINPESYFISDPQGNKYINTKKAFPIDIILKGENGQVLPITTNIVLGSEKNLTHLMVLKENNDKNKKSALGLQNTNSLFIENGKSKIYIVPKYVAGEDKINFVIPGMKWKTIDLDIQPWPLAKISFVLEKEKIDPKSKMEGVINLTDDRGNKLQKDTAITIQSLGPVKVVPSWTFIVKKGERILKFISNEETGLTKILAEGKGRKDTVQWTVNLITKRFFLDPAIDLGLNIMYLNLFGTDRGNQRGYGSDNKKFTENIISRSEKTLAITTQLIDLSKISKASIILDKKSRIENNENLKIQATQKGGKLNMKIAEVGDVSIEDLINKIKVITNDPENKKLGQELGKEKEKVLYLFQLNEDFVYDRNKKAFYTDNGTLIWSLHQDIVFEFTNEFYQQHRIWKLIGKGQELGKTIFTNLDFGKASANIENKAYEFWSILAGGSTNHTTKAIFSKENTLKSSYKGYDSIQNSDEMEKNIGFRSDFKNISLFAWGKNVGEATLPFGSEFLINIGDPLLKRIDTNKNLENADYNEGLGKVVYSRADKTIFKTIDIDYNNDGLRDLLVIYRDGTISLQKQYQDKAFKDMWTLMLSAEPIKEVFVGDVDGNKYEDIIVRNTKDQLRIYRNNDGVFDVDGNLACLNTNVNRGEKSETPESLSGVHQFFIKDMDLDGKIDIVTLDIKGYLKIFYGEGKDKNHSYLSQEVYACDEDRYKRQEKSHKLIKKFWLQVNGEAVTDESLIRRDGLHYPTDEEIEEMVLANTDAELWMNLDEGTLTKISNPKEWKKCRIDSEDEGEVYSGVNAIDFTKMAQAWISIFDKYTKNPFTKIVSFNDGGKPEEQAFIEISKLDSEKDPVEVIKTYQDLNGGSLENGDIIRVTVGIVNKKAKFWDGAAFFDKIQWPRNHLIDEETWWPQNLQFIQGRANIHRGIKGYSYYLTDLELVDKRLAYSYELSYEMNDPIYTITIEDIDIEDYSVEPKIIRTAPADGMKADRIPDIIVQTVDGCNKKKSVLFNDKDDGKRSYRESTIDLQELSDAHAEIIENQKNKSMKKVKSDIQKSKSVDTMDTIPWLSEVQETYSQNNIFEVPEENDAEKPEKQKPNLKELLLSDDPIFVEFFSKQVDQIEKVVQDIADGSCKGFSFWLPNVKACDGLPIPFNQAFLVPGKYHLMGCIPLEPLTRTLGKGLPVFHFPGTLPTPVGPIPIPWGLKGPGDGFLWAPGGTYPSLIRIYVAPTLTAQLGLAICFWPYSIGNNLVSPFSDIGGNCIVLSMPLPCGKKKQKTDPFDAPEAPPKEEVYHSWGKDYQTTNTCELKKTQSPFRAVASTTLNTHAPSTQPSGLKKFFSSDTSWVPASIPEGSYLWGIINIEYDTITSELDQEQNGIFIEGVKVQGVKDIKNKILWGKQQGIKHRIAGWFDRQVQYWINNLLRFRMDVVLPDIEQLNEQFSSFNIKEIQKLVGEGLEEERQKMKNLNKNTSVKSLIKNTLTQLHSKEELTSINLANGDNPFEKLQTFFNTRELINISTQNIFVRIPRIYSEDIEAYKAYLQTREETNKAVIDDWAKIIELSYKSCLSEEKNQDTKKCEQIQAAKTQIIQMQGQFDKTSKQIFENIQTLELYKRFPLEIYEWLHVSDRYLWELSMLLSKFFSYLNYWMEINAHRFSQYVDAIITIIGVVKTYQVMVDLFVDRGNRCWKCTQDSYDQYACKLNLLCPDIPVIPLPNVKIPSLYIDLSDINLGMDIVLPRFRFAPEALELPRIPNLPEPPQLGINFKVDFKLPEIPLLPPPPNLPELPSFIPQVKMKLPILPPAPKIPELPTKVKKAVNLAKKLSKIYCIIKSGIGLVGENSAKARIEQMTQRTYEVPWVDKLDLTNILRLAPLQGVDLELKTTVNLHYNFDAFYSFLKGMVDGINATTYGLVSEVQEGLDKVQEHNDKVWNTLDEMTNHQIQLTPKIGYKEDLHEQLLGLQEVLTLKTEKQKIDPLLTWTSTDTTIAPNRSSFSTIENEVSHIVKQEKTDLLQLADLAKSDYTSFLKTMEQQTQKKPLQLSFQSSLLEGKDHIAKKVISENNPVDLIMTTEGKRVNGYLMALNRYDAKSLNLSQKDYQEAKNYLETIQTKLNQRNNIQKLSYAGTTNLTKKEGGTSTRTLLSQATSKKPEKIKTATSDMSSYINGVLVKDHKRNFINVVHSKVNYERFLEHYQTDLNNDKKPEVITRDENNIYIKYADDTEAKIGQKFKTYTLITPQLKNKDTKYEQGGGSLRGGKDKIKVYDQNREVKNFKIGGQTFDTLNFSWTNNKFDDVDGYLMRISERVDGLLEKNDLDKVKYLLFLPNGTKIEGLRMQIEGQTFKIESQIGKLIYEVQYYNPANDTLEFNLHEVPRKWQYLQVTSLKKNSHLYVQNAPRSNQEVGGRQIVADSEPPKPKVELIRNRKPLVVDEGFDLEGFIGSYYDLKVTWTDNVLVRHASIYEGEKRIAHETINAAEGTITLRDLFFTKSQVKNYTITALDSEGNKKSEEVSLEIKIPKISIENIERFSGRREGIQNPVLISSTLETDIDKGDVSFERKRKEKISTLTAIQKGQKIQIYPVSTYQTQVTGAYYDFWDLIGMYGVKDDLIASINGHNGEITIQPAYKKTVHLGIDFAAGYPVVKVLQGTQTLFEIILKSEQLLYKQLLQGNILPLEGESYGKFEGGEVVIKNKEPLLYIAKDGTLWSNKPLQWSYQFNSQEQSVTYTLSENAFSEPFITLSFKVKSL